LNGKGFLLLILALFVVLVVALSLKDHSVNTTSEGKVNEEETISVEGAWSLIEDQAQLYHYLKDVAPESCDISKRLVWVLLGEGSNKMIFEVLRINADTYKIKSSGEIWQQTLRLDMRPDLHKSKPGDQLVLWVLTFKNNQFQEECNFVVNETRGTYIPLNIVQHL